MFREIGVDVRWRQGAVRAYAGENDCGAPIAVRIEDTPHTRVKPGVLANATPFAESAALIRVFWDRVEESGSRDLATALLAHVLAHEITHVLEGIDRHSADGLMKARWDPDDHRHMEFHSLPFAAEDVELIHLGIAKRMLHASAE